MGGCKETSGGMFPNSVCHKFEKIAASCCEDPNYSGTIKIKMSHYRTIYLNFAPFGAHIYRNIYILIAEN